jgi:multicomponent Na+:H+ antiporter subunit E
VLRRGVALWCWAFLTWVLLSWTLTLEQLLVGAVLAVVVAVGCAPLGDVAAPWTVLRPRSLLAVLRLAGWALPRVVGANISLSRRIWSPRRPLRPGMVIVPTQMRTDGELTAVGLVTSLIVDNQVVDVDRGHHEMQYHAVWVDTPDPDRNRDLINGPVEERLAGVRGR